MHMLSAWEQTAVFNPADPTQLKIERYAANPGGYTTYYFNRGGITLLVVGKEPRFFPTARRLRLERGSLA